MDSPQTFAGFVFWAFCAFLTGIPGFFIYAVRSDFKEASHSLKELAITVSGLTERLHSFEKSLDRLDDRLRALEELSRE